MRTGRVAKVRDRLIEAMVLTNKKQVDLVAETGLNRSTISRYISGDVEPKSDAIYKLAKSLNVSESWLIGYDVPMERKTTPSPSKQDLSEGEKILLDLFNKVPEDQQKLVLQMIRAALGSQEQ